MFSREWCHLCHEMVAALESLRGEFEFDVEVLDVDLDPALEAKYSEWVPVLEDASGRALCHYFLDEPKVREYLRAFR